MISNSWIKSTVAGLVLAYASNGYSQALFKLNGKSYSGKDLDAAKRSQLYEVEFENYKRMESTIDSFLLELHVDELAAKQGKTHHEVEEKLFIVKDPTEKEMKTWYEENKARIPPQFKFEQIKDQIVGILKEEKRKSSRADLITKIKKNGKFQLALTEPKAPVFKISTKGYPSKGSQSAKITIVEFADYQCPHCKAAGPEVKKVLKKYGKDVRLVYIDFPINRSGISTIVAQGGVCAKQQNKYWEYHELAFEKQKTLKADSPTALAKELKLDVKKFDACLKSEGPKKFVAAAKAEGERIGVTGTPAIFVNGKKVLGFHMLDDIVGKELKRL